MNALNQLVGRIASPVVIVILAVIVLGVIVLWVRVVIRWRQARWTVIDVHCSRCGYDLKGLNLPRCPECGALRGFNKSAEELGIENDVNFTDQNAVRK